jgi:hypothetical protein
MSLSLLNDAFSLLSFWKLSMLNLFLGNFTMKKADAIKKANGLGNLAAILGITKSAISQWPDDVPSGRLYELQVKRPEWFANDGANQIEAQSQSTE